MTLSARAMYAIKLPEELEAEARRLLGEWQAKVAATPDPKPGEELGIDFEESDQCQELLKLVKAKYPLEGVNVYYTDPEMLDEDEPDVEPDVFWVGFGVLQFPICTEEARKLKGAQWEMYVAYIG